MDDRLTEEWTLDAFIGTIHQGNVALWSWDPERRTARFDALGQRFWGVDGPDQSLDDLFLRMDERDRAQASAAWIASATRASPYEFDFRIDANDAPRRWISARGVGGEAGRKGGRVLAIFVDVTHQREAQETLQRVVGEMAHRIGNLFGVASSMTRLAAADAGSVPDLVGDVEKRFGALRSAFTFAVGDGTTPLDDTPLAHIAERLVSAYNQGTDRVRVDIPGDILIDGRRITDLAMILHELATNSVKYGSLGHGEGTVEVVGESDGETVRLRWTEAGGRPVEAIPEASGFGSRLIEHTVERSLGGAIERRIEDGHLVVSFRFSAEALCP